MLWKDREGSSNVEDRRGEGGGFGGGGPRFPLPRGKMGLAVLRWFWLPVITELT